MIPPPPSTTRTDSPFPYTPPFRSLPSAVNILDLPGGLGCEAGGDLMGPYDHQIWSSSGSKYACAWDYGRARVIQQPVESTQVIGRATFKMAEIGRAHV